MGQGVGTPPPHTHTHNHTLTNCVAIGFLRKTDIDPLPLRLLEKQWALSPSRSGSDCFSVEVRTALCEIRWWLKTHTKCCHNTVDGILWIRRCCLLHICYVWIFVVWQKSRRGKESWPRGYKICVQSQTQNKAQWLASCGHVSPSSQSFRFIFEFENELKFDNLGAWLLYVSCSCVLCVYVLVSVPVVPWAGLGVVIVAFLWHILFVSSLMFTST